MKRIEKKSMMVRAVTFAAMLSLCLFTAVSSVKADTTGTVYTDGNPATVRSGPGTSYESVGSAANGTTVTITASESDGTHTWYKVTGNGIDGYIREDLITGEDTSAIGNSTDTSSDTEDTSEDDTDDASTDTLTAVVGDETYQVSERFTEEDIPDGFTESETTYGGQTVKCVYNETTGMTLVYLKSDADDSRTFFVYSPDTQSFLPYFTVSGTNGTLTIENMVLDTTAYTNLAPAVLPGDSTGTITAYQDTNNSLADCYYVYGVDSTGYQGWFMYDSTNGSFVKTADPTTASTVTVVEDTSDEESEIGAAYNELKDQYQADKNKLTRIVIGLIIAIAVLLVIVINLLLFGRGEKVDVFDDDEDDQSKKKHSRKKKKVNEDEEEEQEDEAEDDSEEKKPAKLSREEKRQLKKEKRRKKKEFWDDDEDEDTPIWYNAGNDEETAEDAEENKSEEENILAEAVGAIMEGDNASEAAKEVPQEVDIEAALAKALEAEIAADDEKQEVEENIVVPSDPTIDLSRETVKPVRQEAPVQAAAVEEPVKAEEPVKVEEPVKPAEPEEEIEYFDFDDDEI